jgi:hypothetical protein
LSPPFAIVTAAIAEQPGTPSRIGPLARRRIGGGAARGQAVQAEAERNDAEQRRPALGNEERSERLGAARGDEESDPEELTTDDAAAPQGRVGEVGGDEKQVVEVSGDERRDRYSDLRDDIHRRVRIYFPASTAHSATSS